MTATFPRLRELSVLRPQRLSGRSSPDRSQSIFNRSRACFAGQNLSATIATPLPRMSGISNTSRTPSTARACVVDRSSPYRQIPADARRAAIFIPGRSRSSPNFCDPSHFDRLSSRRTLFPMIRNSDGFLRLTSPARACAPRRSRDLHSVPIDWPGRTRRCSVVRHWSGVTRQRSAAVAINIARIFAPNSRYCWKECAIEPEPPTICSRVQRILVDFRRRRKLRNDLRPVGIQLIGEDHRQRRVNSLTELETINRDHDRSRPA